MEAYNGSKLKGWSALLMFFSLLIFLASVLSCGALESITNGGSERCPYSCATIGCSGGGMPMLNIPVVSFEEKNIDSILTIYVRFHFQDDLYGDTLMSKAAFEMLSDANDLFEGMVHFSLPIDHLYYSASIDNTIEEYNHDLNKLYDLNAYADDNMINVYVLRSEGILNGFTILPEAWMDLTGDSRWNSIFLASDVYNKNTFGHELGHFFGLSHIGYDIDNPNCDVVSENIMSYMTCRSRFIPTQFDTIATVLTDLRSYLIQ